MCYFIGIANRTNQRTINGNLLSWQANFEFVDVMIQLKTDLHCHSHFSDGRLSVKELIDRAHNMQLDVLALTDHDTVAGIQPAVDYQQQLNRPLHIVAGIELSTAWHGFDIHVVGLGIDHHCPDLLARLEMQAASRQQRAKTISEKLHKAGVSECYDEVARMASPGQITRAHFARWLVNNQVVDTQEKAFKKYLGKGQRAHVKPEWISIEQAVTWITEAGGKAVLAHPGHYKLSAKWLRRLLETFKQAGGHGLEVVHNHLSPAMRLQLKQYAIDYQLQGSAGSDFHFPSRWTELGKNLSLPEEVVPIWQDCSWYPTTIRKQQ